MLRHLTATLLALCLLTGCAPLLERSYTVSEPHSSKFWESEAAGTLRAENYQDIVNDLLILIGQHTESAVLRLYGFTDDQSAAEQLEQAMLEVQQETPLGAYAVDYITSVGQTQRSYYEAALQIGYRRSTEQIQTIVNATSSTAIHDLLDAALDGGRAELVVRMGYWRADSREQISQAVVDLRQEREIPTETVWPIHYYPSTDPVGIVEFLLQPSQEEVDTYLAQQAALNALASEADGAAPETAADTSAPPPKQKNEKK